jgi:hypothetical protein
MITIQKQLILVVIFISMLVINVSFPAKATSERLYFNELTTPEVNKTYVIEARIDPNGTSVNAVQFEFAYNPTLLQIVNIDSNTSAFEIEGEQSNIGNKIVLARGTINNITTDSLVAFIEVRPLAQTALSFTNNANIVNGGFAIPSIKEDLNINPNTPVFRFWSEQNKRHFYTSNATEKQQVIDLYDDNVWKYEGVANYAKSSTSDACLSGIQLYRFWSEQNKSHFYTSNATEKQQVIDLYDDNVWKYEGVAYCVGTTSSAEFTKEVYRFWSEQNKSHFYTSNATEKQQVIDLYDDNVWKYEGVAYYSIN